MKYSLCTHWHVCVYMNDIVVLFCVLSPPPIICHLCPVFGIVDSMKLALTTCFGDLFGVPLNGHIAFPFCLPFKNKNCTGQHVCMA